MAGSSWTTPHRLPPRWRKLLLTTHVATSVGLLGTVVLSVYKPFGRIRKSSVTARAT